MIPQRDDAAQNDEHPWEQLPGENNRWYSRFSAYLALGPARSMRAVYRQERGETRSRAVPSSWNQIFQQFDWRRRAEVYDAHTRKMVFAQGNASDTERVRNLALLAERMYIRLMAEVDTMPVNDRFIAQYLAVLDILAKHTNGYSVQRIEHTGKGGQPIEIHSEGNQPTQVQVLLYMPKVGSFDTPLALAEPSADETSSSASDETEPA